MNLNAKRRIIARAACSLAMLSAGLLVHASNIITLPVFERRPSIDGRVTPQEIEGAPVTSMTLMAGRAVPKNQTDVYMYLAGEALYVAFKCQDKDPSRISATVTKENGPVFEDDAVELFMVPAIDPNKRKYFHFAINAAGTRYSSNMADDQPVVGWNAAARRTPDGWEAEMLIPFASIHGSTDVPYWRANMSRHDVADQETSCWLDPGTTMHNYKRFGFLRFEKGGEISRMLNVPGFSSEQPIQRQLPAPTMAPTTGVQGFGAMPSTQSTTGSMTVPGFSITPTLPSDAFSSAAAVRK